MSPAWQNKGEGLAAHTNTNTQQQSTCAGDVRDAMLEGVILRRAATAGLSRCRGKGSAARRV